MSSSAKLWEPVLYQGPTPEGGEVKNREAAAVLEEYNLILEVRGTGPPYALAVVGLMHYA
jgi:hypothetical protein